MRFSYFIAPLVLLPLCVFAQPKDLSRELSSLQNPAEKNTIIHSYSNQSEHLITTKGFERTIDYPTQIIRIEGATAGQQLNCDEVFNEIKKNLLDHIYNDKFIFNASIGCVYDPDTKFGIEYSINSYFDPVDDQAIDDLKSYLAKYNGSDLMGTPLKIESAKGLIVSLNIAAGMRKNPDNPPFIEYFNSTNNFYFKNHYEMYTKLFADIEQNFYSNNPEKIFPFLDKWVFPHAGIYFESTLRDSNYVRLQPEHIFLMEREGDIYESYLKYTFGHSCIGYENHRCLKED